MGLKAEKAVEAMKLDAEIVKIEYVQLYNSKRKQNKGDKGEGTNHDSEAVLTTLAVAKVNLEKAKKAVQAVNVAVTMEGAKTLSSMEISLLVKPCSLGKNPRPIKSHSLG